MDHRAHGSPLFASRAEPSTGSEESHIIKNGSGFDSGDLASVLNQALGYLAAMGDEFSSECAGIQNLKGRLAEGRFHLAVLGQFKRGKSTLLNALLGEAILPTSVIPLTAIPTFIRVGEELAVKVFYENGKPADEFAPQSGEKAEEILSKFVTEAGNPKNTLGVSHVEIFHPAGILRKGVVLIDTPGIGSTFRHNTEATLNFLPQCDAALFLVSADPPVTEVETEFLGQVRSKVSRLFFVLNKVDYLEQHELEAALAFFQKILKEQAGFDDETRIFCISARWGLKARSANDASLWAQSGLKAVEEHLVDFLAREKAAVLHEALSRKACDLLESALLKLRLVIRSWQMPLEELAQRLTLFEEKLAEIKRERQIADDIMKGDRRRMHEFLQEQSAELRKRSNDYLKGVLRENMSRGHELSSEAVQDRMADVIPDFFEHQLGVITELFDQKMAEVLKPHQQRADSLIESVRKAAANLFDIPYHAPESIGAFQMYREPHWVTHKWSSTVNPIPPGAFDRLLPWGMRRARIMKRVLDEIHVLVVQNVENLRWATYQSIEQTVIRFGSLLDERLADTVAATHGAIQAALARRKEHSESISGDVARLETAVRNLSEIRSKLRE